MYSGNTKKSYIEINFLNKFVIFGRLTCISVFVVSVWRGFLFLWVPGMGYAI